MSNASAAGFKVFVAGLALTTIVAGTKLAVGPAQFYHSYMVGFIFWLNVSLGCLAILMIQHLSGGAWGLVSRRTLEAGTRVLPFMLLAFLPVLAGMTHYYPWTHAKEVASDKVLLHKAAYLNVPFFTVRAAVYFVVWIGLAGLLGRWSLQQDAAGSREDAAAIAKRMGRLSGPGLVLYALTVTFASIDWLMSTDPHWHSSMYGPLFAVGQILTAFAFVIIVAARLNRSGYMAGKLTPRHFHDLGKLMLAFLLLWAYMTFSQFLIIWSGNKKDEIPWYIARLEGGWQVMSVLLIVLHFAVPFLLLLSRDLKRRAASLAAVALGILVMRFVDLDWIIAPSLNHHTVAFMWADLLTVLGIGGLWVGIFLRELARYPLLPEKDPYYEEALAHGRE